MGHKEKFTISEKILSEKSGEDVYTGDYTTASIETATAQDGTAPLTLNTSSVPSADVRNGSSSELNI
ncbi:hypothetical protein AKJ41_05245 [candidate division MSBL1 archaeon SCGC-AAA259O05]|uniref:Uncharacterized protein n=1 Tax=candidate division MSBL1 archaeon SCGC-AAA259O05 TaxID=1698271 RepID=A0A133UZE5_9EURY|nr:hypothetical protein AKJ41_05245 [candidate division MSBL1 archaeon SCGC-AAA259O05]